MPEVIMYSSQYCPFCFRAKSIFQQKSVTFKELDVDANPQLRKEMMEKSGQRTVPQIWVGELHIGGCDDLMTIQRSGELDELLGISEQFQ
tara:strand:+ start:2448 stop:2717 length:270 start_codon:yes stop_codon:yes gene_type:complete